VRMDEAAIIEAVLRDYPLARHGYHGVGHWARVLTNGLRLAEATGADIEVVTLFAMFHDSRRENDDVDPGHGQRGAEFARTVRGRLFELDDVRFELLCEACRLHTKAQPSADATLIACWDADRLDLPRVGIEVDPERLSGAAARGLIGWAERRACEGFEPPEVFARWRVEHSRD